MKKIRDVQLLMFLLVIIFSAGISAEKIGIDIDNTYVPGEEMFINVILYDDDNNEIPGEVNFEVQNYYTDVIYSGRVNSGEGVVFKLPENSISGYWAVVASYKDVEAKELFNVQELEKADIRLEKDKLIIANIGNVPYKKSLIISIGGHEETAVVPLEVGEKKEIRLTAPEGNYDVRVNDGTQKQDIVFKNVALTGNVIGLESVSSENFWSRYPIVIVFLVVLAILVIIITGARIKKH
ncbi:hypothetical protein GF386_01560 [Candidatus Pacearchaeota archaeon]|nr:hypothetical protein [Candidatus Pacearchaeota archaeon]MBD3282867.1 hypothetical protein [Candidatus Pacearchaeota archaeon]